MTGNSCPPLPQPGAERHRDGAHPLDIEPGLTDHQRWGAMGSPARGKNEGEYGLLREGMEAANAN